MEYSPLLVDDEFENSLLYVKMPFGSPGEESLGWDSKSDGYATTQSTVTDGKMDATGQSVGQLEGVKSVFDYEVDATDCQGSLRDDTSFTDGFDFFATSSDDVFSMSEPKDVPYLAAALDFQAWLYEDRRDDCGNIEWSPIDAAPPATYSVDFSCGDDKASRIAPKGQKPEKKKKRRAVSRGTRKVQLKTAGQPFRVPPSHRRERDSIGIV